MKAQLKSNLVNFNQPLKFVTDLKYISANQVKSKSSAIIIGKGDEIFDTKQIINTFETNIFHAKKT
jgi:hypothetical protein